MNLDIGTLDSGFEDQIYLVGNATLPNPTTDLDRHSESLKRRQRQSSEQNRLFPHINDRVRPVDVYHVHGADIGIVTAIEPWGVFVNWEDGSMGRYAIDELVAIDPAPT